MYAQSIFDVIYFIFRPGLCQKQDVRPTPS